MNYENCVIPMATGRLAVSLFRFADLAKTAGLTPLEFLARIGQNNDILMDTAHSTDPLLRMTSETLNGAFARAAHQLRQEYPETIWVLAENIHCLEPGYRQYIELPVGGMRISYTATQMDGRLASAVISSALGNKAESDEERAAFKVIEAMVLAHAGFGVNVEDPAYLAGLEAAIKAVANKIFS